MKFGRLAISNFLTIGEAGLNLMDRGLLLIQGENEDDTSATSNGAGKSTIGDALSWCLFGVTARGLSGDAVVNRSAGKNCWVTANIFDGDDCYVVTRYRKHATHKNNLVVNKVAIAGGSHSLTQGTEKLTQAVIDKIIGCSYDVFAAAIYAGQEKMPDLPALTDKNLKVLVEEAAGTTVLDSAYEVAKERLRAAEDKAVTADRLIERAVISLKNTDEQVEEMARSMAEWNANQSALIDKKRVDFGNVAAAIKAEQKNIADADKPAVESEIAKCNVILAGVSGELTTERNVHQRLIDTRRETDAKITAAQREQDKAWNEALRLKGVVEKLIHQLKHLDGKIGTACDECGKSYAKEDLAGLEAATRTRATAERAEFDKAKTAFEAAKAKTQSAKDYAENALQSARDTLEAYRRSMTDVSATSARVSSLNEKLLDIAKMESRLTTLNRVARDLGAEVKAAIAAVNPFVDRLIKAKAAQASADESREEALEHKDVARAELDLAADVVKVFSPAGVRAHILDTVTPFLNDRTAQYLGTLSDGNISAVWSTLTRTAKGELREKFKIEVTHAKGGDEFAAISGGEKRKVRLACALALQDLVASRATKPIDLFIGDEIDDALDDAGLERLMAVLEEKARERGTVIIISHNSLRDWIREVVTVTKRGGKSILSEAA